MIPFQEISRLVRQSEELNKQMRQAITHIVYISGGKLKFKRLYRVLDIDRNALLIEGVELQNGNTMVRIHSDFDDDKFLPIARISPCDLLPAVYEQIKDLSEKQQKVILHDRASELALKQVSEPDHNPEAYAHSCFGQYDRLSTLYATGEYIICAVCGTSEVSCEAFVNPNTQEFIEYSHEAFYHANCSRCHSEILVDVVALHSDIDARYKDFIGTHGRAPQLARCRVVNTDRDPVDDDSTYTTLIYLSMQGAYDPGEFRCNGIEGLKSLAFPQEDRPFTLLECSEFV